MKAATLAPSGPYAPAGHDVLAVSEFQVRSVDRELMGMAYRENRILLTEDKDFGWLTFIGQVASPGVILIRFPASARSTLAAAVSELVAQLGTKLEGCFTVLRPGDVRISRLPAEGLTRT